MHNKRSHGVINHTSSRKTDFLYRVSMKGLIRNDKGDVLVVKENGRTWWDLPGGGMDHTESLKDAIAREMKEEVNLEADFTYRILSVDEPVFLAAHGFWQLRLVFEIVPESLMFSTGEDGDAIAFVDPKTLKDSASDVERKIYNYVNL